MTESTINYIVLICPLKGKELAYT